MIRVVRYLIETEPLITIYAIMLLIMAILTIYKYIKVTVKKYKDGKIAKAVMLTAIAIIILSLMAIAILARNEVNYILRESVLRLLYILATTILPIVTLGIAICNDTKNKKIKIIQIIIASIALIFICCVNINSEIKSAQKIITNISNYTIEELLEKDNIEKADTSYLENYTQVLEQKKYLTRFDITNIISIADSKSSLIKINYKDELSNKEIKITNKEDEKIEELKNELKSDYYTFSYNVDNNQVTINIERYIIQ